MASLIAALQIDGNVVADMISRGWANFLDRPSGSMKFRFLLQPTVATLLAARAGIKDAREGREPYLWGALTNPTFRWQLLHGGWKDMRTPFFVAAALDATYQILTHRFIYPLELIFTATLLALVPYFVLRGPINRIARHFVDVANVATPKVEKNEGP